MLATAEQLAREGQNRVTFRDLHFLRGEWYSRQGDWRLAAESLGEAVRLAREVGQRNASAEAGLVLARFHLREVADAPAVAAALAAEREVAHRPLAALFLALGDRAAAEKHALAAYKDAWADGEPFVHRYELTEASALLGRLAVAVPDLPVFDPAAVEEIPYEAEIVGAIAAARAERGKKKRR